MRITPNPWCNGRLKPDGWKVSISGLFVCVFVCYTIFISDRGISFHSVMHLLYSFLKKSAQIPLRLHMNKKPGHGIRLLFRKLKSDDKKEALLFSSLHMECTRWEFNMTANASSLAISMDDMPSWFNGKYKVRLWKGN